ncbi:MAG: discoidin domain-containing protein [Clostridia bacterium]|nr:discoidin domain-containing protein [Clostridia bacterium]
MKKLSACLLAALLFLAACTSEESAPEPPPASTYKPPVTEPYVSPALPEEWGDDAQNLLSVPWTVVSSGAAGALTFDGERVRWELSSPNGSAEVEGVPAFEDGVMTVDGQEFRWKTLAAYCLLTTGGETWRLTRADSVDEARRAFRLVNGTWSGSGMTLSFEDQIASLSLGDRSIQGGWTLSNDGTLKISSSAEGFNLAKGAKVKADSIETLDFPPELAFDGDFSTRYSSAYNDPVTVTADLGKTKTIGCAVLYFETAYSSEFKIEYKNAQNQWVEAAHVKRNSQSGVDQPVTVPFKNAVEAREIRFVGLKRGTDWGHSFYELELYENVPGTAEMKVYAEGEEMVVLFEGLTYRLTKGS